MLKPNHSNVPVTKKKTNFIPAKTRTTLTYLSVNSYKVLLITEAFTVSFILYSFSFNHYIQSYFHIILVLYLLWGLLGYYNSCASKQKERSIKPSNDKYNDMSGYFLLFLIIKPQ